MAVHLRTERARTIMYAIKLTPQATLGLFIAHQAHQPKGIGGMRAAIDCDRVFFSGEGAGLLRALDGGKIEVVAREAAEALLENHVYEHLKAAITAAVDDGKTFGYRNDQKHPSFGAEAYDAVEKAEKREAPAVPKLVEGKKEKRA